MATDLDVAFPTLSEQDITALAARGHPRDVRAGEILFTAGDRNFCFFVVLEGAVEILEHRADGAAAGRRAPSPGSSPVTWTCLPAAAAVVTGRVGEDGRVLQLSATELRQAVDELPELGETIVKAFLMRRELLLGSGLEGVRIIGSRFSPDAHRLRDFATRNRFRSSGWTSRPTSRPRRILRQFNIPAGGYPDRAGPGRRVQANRALQEFARCAGLTVASGGGPRLRPGGRGCRAGGAGRLGVRGVRRARRAHRRSAGGRRSGRHQLADRELPRLSRRDLGGGAHPERDCSRPSASAPASRCRARSARSASTAATGSSPWPMAPGSATRCVLVASGVEYRQARRAPLRAISRAPGSTTPPPRWRRGYAGARRSWSSAAGTRRGRRSCILADYARRVHVVLPGDGPGRQHVALPGGPDREAGERHGRTAALVVTALEGERSPERGAAPNRRGGSGASTTNSLFLFIGADPNTSWLRGCVELDAKGFVLTGSVTSARRRASSSAGGARDARRSCSRPACPASSPRAMSGAARSSGCASAVGEGAMAVSFVHAHIARPA